MQPGRDLREVGSERERERALWKNCLLVEGSFPSTSIRSGLNQEDCIAGFQQHKDFRKCIGVSPDFFRRSIDIERVNALINRDMPDDGDSWRFRTRDLISNNESTTVCFLPR